MNPYSRLSTVFMKAHPESAARSLENFAPELVAEYLVASNPVVAQQVLKHFTPIYAASCIGAMDNEASGRIFCGLDAGFQLLLARQLDGEKREALMANLPAEQVSAIRRQLPYAEGMAGSLMEAPLASVPEDLVVRTALKRIKRIRRGPKFFIYATDTNGRLTGVLTLHELMNAPSASSISEVMHRHVVSISPIQSVKTLMSSAYWQSYFTLPVTDGDDTLLGVIRHRTLLRLQEQSVHADAIGSGLDALVSIGELFSLTAGHLLESLIVAGSSTRNGSLRD